MTKPTTTRPQTADPLDDPASFIQMARGLMQMGRVHGAWQLAVRAETERPGDTVLMELARAITADHVPKYHEPMLLDATRNRAYRSAIDANARGRRVLDIGTGSGLLAMMAARAGAEHVYACEKDERLAATAREIVAANGLTDRITVLPYASTQLHRMDDLGGGVDLVVSEIFGHQLIDEGVLPSLRHAREELCRPGATFLPGTAEIRVALAYFDGYEDPTMRLSNVEGFDVSAFARHMRSDFFLRQNAQGLYGRSEPHTLYSFDFSRDAPPCEQVRLDTVSLGGRVTGIVQWIHFTCAPGLHFENAPGGRPESHWELGYFPLAQPFNTAPGQPVSLHGWRDEEILIVWAEPELG